MTAMLAAGLAGVACWLFLSVPRLRRLLPIRSDRRWRRKETALSIAAGALTAVVFDGWWAVIAGMGVAAAVYVLSRRRSDPEKWQRLVQQLPDVLGFLAVVLESGRPCPWLCVWLLRSVLNRVERCCTASRRHRDWAWTRPRYGHR